MSGNQNLKKKKSASTKTNKVLTKRSVSKKRKGFYFKKYFLSIVIASFIFLFLLWRVFVLIPKTREVREFTKETKTPLLQIQKKDIEKKIEKEEKIEAEKKIEERQPIISKEEKERVEKKFLDKIEDTKNEKEEKVNKKEPIITKKKEKPQIPSKEANCSIVIDDVGNSIELLAYAMKVLPKSTTFAILPFQKYSRESAELLTKEGFHIILHSPMEAEENGFYNNIPYLIKSSMTKREVEIALEKQLESVPFAEGMNNHTGSKATKNQDLMRNVMRIMKSHGLYFLDSRTTPFSVAHKVAIEEKVPSIERKVFLDDDNSENDIILKVDEFVLLALKEEQAVAIGHLRINTIKVLEKRINYWQNRGVNFISLSDIINKYGTGNYEKNRKIH